MNYFGAFPTMNAAFVTVASAVSSRGEANDGRDRTNVELQNVLFSVTEPRARLIDIPSRRTNGAFLVAEFLWHLSERTDVAMLRHYAPSIARYSPDGVTFTGTAYGPRIFSAVPELGCSQWDHVVACLREDPATRRAVIVIGRATESRLAANRDVTCTTALHFLVRRGRLELTVTMRSNDVMRGMQSDIFLFTLLQELAAIELGLPLGPYTHFCTLMQIYGSDLAWADECVQSPPSSDGVMNPLPGDGVRTDGVRTAFAGLVAAEEVLRTSGSDCTVPGPLDAWMSVLRMFATSAQAPRNYASLLRVTTNE
jgi:thymidylate synthase